MKGGGSLEQITQIGMSVAQMLLQQTNAEQIIMDSIVKYSPSPDNLEMIATKFDMIAKKLHEAAQTKRNAIRPIQSVAVSGGRRRRSRRTRKIRR